MAEKGLYTRMLESYENNGDCERRSVPKSRYQLCKDLMTGHIKEVFKINILMLLFFLPLLIVIFLSVINAETNSMLYPFGTNLGVGYPAVPDLQGTSQWLAFQNGMRTGIMIALASIVASVGLAGGMYAVRNLIWTEGVFIAKDFWRGVKLNYVNALQAALFFCAAYLLTTTAINVSELNIAMQEGNVALWRTSQVVSWILLAIASMMTLWMIALGVTYKTNLFNLLKNSFLLMVGTLPQTVFFGAIAILPFAAFLLGAVNSLFTSFALMMMTLISFAFSLLVWLSFAQWVFDRYINPKTTSAKHDSTIYNKDGTPQLTGDDSASVLEYQRAMVAAGRSRLLSTPVQPLDDGVEVYALPEKYTRADIKKAQAGKDALKADAAAYVREHEKDARYVEYIEGCEARERALLEQENKDKKDKKKKK